MDDQLANKVFIFGKIDCLSNSLVRRYYLQLFEPLAFCDVSIGIISATGLVCLNAIVKINFGTFGLVYFCKSRLSAGPLLRFSLTASRNLQDTLQAS